jgi:hypothetical protein
MAEDILVVKANMDKVCLGPKTDDAESDLEEVSDEDQIV